MGQIVKSLVFRGGWSARHVLVLASGVNRVDESKISEPIEKADASFVLERTGFAIGGVPPVGHTERPVTFVDEDLTPEGEFFWAAAGHTHIILDLDPKELVGITGEALSGCRDPTGHAASVNASL